MPLRLFMTMLVIPTVLALGVMAAILLPGDDSLSGTRFTIGRVAFVAVQLGGLSFAGFRHLRRG